MACLRRFVLYEIAIRFVSSMPASFPTDCIVSHSRVWLAPAFGAAGYDTLSMKLLRKRGVVAITQSVELLRLDIFEQLWPTYSALATDCDTASTYNDPSLLRAELKRF